MEAQYYFLDSAGATKSADALPLESVCLGHGVFTSALLLSGKVILADRHLRRLTDSAAALGIAPPAVARAVFDAAEALAARTPLARARFRLTIFAADGRRGAGGVLSLAEARPAGEPQSLCIAGFRRGKDDPLASHKTASCAANIVARRAARDAGFDDALFLDADGNLADTSRANIFLYADGRLLTPALNGALLPGIARGAIIEACPRVGLELRETAVPAAALDSCEMAFVTNSVAGVCPVLRLGGRQLPDPRGAKWFAALERAYGVLTSA